MKPIHFCLPIFLSINLLLSLSEADAIDYAACTLSQYRCGGDTYVIRFPFRLPESMPDYCGGEGFNLTCNSNGMLMINISDESYQVKSIDYATNVLTVVNPDLVSGNQPCPQRVTNTTLDFSLFTYAAFDVNLTFFSNCSSPFSFPWLIPANCTEFGPNNYYYYSVNEAPSIIELLQSCSSVGVFAINQTAASNFLEGGRTDIGDVLQGGFGVNWTSGTEWCSSCQSSGGMCGNDPVQSSAPNCFCPNGTVSSGKECGKQGNTSDAPLPSSLTSPATSSPFSTASPSPTASSDPTHALVLLRLLALALAHLSFHTHSNLLPTVVEMDGRQKVWEKRHSRRRKQS